jgi:hypothetical protein
LGGLSGPRLLWNWGLNLLTLNLLTLNRPFLFHRLNANIPSRKLVPEKKT